MESISFLRRSWTTASTSSSWVPGKKIDITLENGSVIIRDYGRGVPHGKLIECVARINTGAKYDTGAFYRSVGLNGVGTKAVNALSNSFIIESFRGWPGQTGRVLSGEN